MGIGLGVDAGQRSLTRVMFLTLFASNSTQLCNKGAVSSCAPLSPNFQMNPFSKLSICRQLFAVTLTKIGIRGHERGA